MTSLGWPRGGALGGWRRMHGVSLGVPVELSVWYIESSRAPLLMTESGSAWSQRWRFHWLNLVILVNAGGAVPDI